MSIQAITSPTYQQPRTLALTSAPKAVIEYFSDDNEYDEDDPARFSVVSQQPARVSVVSQQSISQMHEPLRERAVSSSIAEEADELTNDPIELAPLVDPVIDQCGHTFSRATLFRLARVIDADGVEDPNLVPCPFSRQPIHLDNLINNLYARKAVSFVNRVYYSYSSPSEVESMAKEIRLEGERFFKKQEAIHNRELQNIFEMTICDRLMAVIEPAHLVRVKSRNNALQMYRA